jgi:thiopurine S-methyltransferase
MMEVHFWHQRWQTNQIGFHESKPHVLLLAHFQALALTKGQRVFLPLCGKTLDIHWLLAQGYQVVGVELSALAVEQLFESLNIQPNITTVEGFTLYRAPKDFGFTIDIFVGDFFDLNSTILGEVAAIYDRAALVALPDDMRERYTKHLMSISHMAQQLLICVEYDHTRKSVPPFSINSALVHDYYAKNYQLTHLETSTIAGGLKGKVPATEAAWRLSAHPKHD